jgi:cell division protein FtsW
MVFERMLHRRRPEDLMLLGGVMLLALTGLVMVMSASLQIGETRLGSPFYFFNRHFVYLLLALAAGIATYLLAPIALLDRLRVLALAGAGIVLLLVLLPGIGREVNGSQRWIAFPGFNIQASELAKLGYLIWLAGYINLQREALVQRWQAFLIPLGVLGVLSFLLLLEPDFGAAVVLGIATFGMLFMAGVPMLRFLSIALAVVAAAALIALLQPYRVARLMNFLDPWADQFGGGYQLTQSLIAFGRGHVDGVGLGNSVQKLFYLHAGVLADIPAGVSLAGKKSVFQWSAGVGRRSGVCVAGVRQHGCQYGSVADKGTDPATGQLWWQLAAGHSGDDRSGVANRY